jgi:hypothetical protein
MGLMSGVRRRWYGADVLIGTRSCVAWLVARTHVWLRAVATCLYPYTVQAFDL